VGLANFLPIPTLINSEKKKEKPAAVTEYLAKSNSLQHTQYHLVCTSIKDQGPLLI
jgi:hypothetical protein